MNSQPPEQEEKTDHDLDKSYTKTAIATSEPTCTMTNTTDIYMENSSSDDKILARKLPSLLNNIQTLYDMNSSRCRKRCDQMRKRKDKLEVHDEDPCRQEKRKSLLSKHKVYLDEDIEEIENVLFIGNNDTVKSNWFDIDGLDNNLCGVGTSKSNSVKDCSSEKTLNSYVNSNETDANLKKENEIEIIISDLEVSFEQDKIDDLTKGEQIINSNILLHAPDKRSFIPMTNSLNSRLCSNSNNLTDSYLMALLGSKGSDTQSEQCDRQSKASVNRLYDVETIIEEDCDFSDNEEKDDSKVFSKSVLIFKQKYSANGD